MQEICTCMGRLLDHVKQFVEAELGTEGSVDGNHRLVLRYANPYYKDSYIDQLARHRLASREHLDHAPVQE